MRRAQICHYLLCVLDASQGTDMMSMMGHTTCAPSPTFAMTALANFVSSSLWYTFLSARLYACKCAHMRGPARFCSFPMMMMMMMVIKRRRLAWSKCFYSSSLHDWGALADLQFPVCWSSRSRFWAALVVLVAW